MSFPIHDPVALSKALIRRPSVTPLDEGALSVLEEHLAPLDFSCHRLTFTEEGTPDVDNLYARFGKEGPNLCLQGIRTLCRREIYRPGLVIRFSQKFAKAVFTVGAQPI